MKRTVKECPAILGINFFTGVAASLVWIQLGGEKASCAQLKVHIMERLEGGSILGNSQKSFQFSEILEHSWRILEDPAGINSDIQKSS